MIWEFLKAGKVRPSTLRLQRDLQAGSEQLMAERGPEGLLPALQAHWPDLHAAWILGWTPSQDFDIYTVLISGDTVVHVELARDTERSVKDFEVADVADWRRSLSRVDRRLLDAALGLVVSEQDI